MTPERPRRVFQEGFLASIAILLISTAMCLFAVRMTIESGVPMILLGMCLATWAIKDPPRRNLANKLAIFAFLNGLMLMVIPFMGNGHPTLWEFFVAWAAEFAVLIAGLWIMMPVIGLHAWDMRREPIPDLSSESSYWNGMGMLYLGVRPTAALFAAFVFATLRYFAGPQYPILSLYGLSYASLLPTALIFPFASTLLWYAFLDPTGVATLKPRIEWPVRGRPLAILLTSAYLLGLLLQFRSPVEERLGWTFGYVNLALVFCFLWLASSRSSSPCPPTPWAARSTLTSRHAARSGVVFTFAVLTFAALLYLALGLVR